MADWPQSRPFDSNVLSVVSTRSLTGGINIGAPATAAWPLANRALYIPFRLNLPFLVAQMWVIVGTSISGSVDLGIYSYDGTRLVSSGIGTPTAINAIYSVDLNDLQLNPGRYFMAMSNGIVGAFQRHAPGGVALNAMGYFQEASAHPLPAVAAFAANTTSYLPCMGLTSKSTI